MKLLRQSEVPLPSGHETVFRSSFWGALITFLLFLSGLLIGAALLVYCYYNGILWGTILAGGYLLMMWGLCHILLRVLKATFARGNWQARIGANGLLLKYRSYLHDDLPQDDPIVLQLDWYELAEARLEKEQYTTTDGDTTRQLTRWFLALQLDSRFVEVEKIRTALEFEFQRKPAHARIGELRHELFLAKKRRDDAAAIRRLKEELAAEKRQHPGKRNRGRFRDRPLTFIKPDLLKMEWTNLRPGRKRLQMLLTRHVRVGSSSSQHFDIEQPMSDAEFKTLLTTLLNRDETIEALKLVRLQRGLGIVEAKMFLEEFHNAGERGGQSRIEPS